MNLWRCCITLLLVLTEQSLGQDILCDDYEIDYFTGISIINARGDEKLSKSCFVDFSNISNKPANHTADAENITNLYIGHAPSGYISQNLLEKLPGLQYLAIFHSNMENSGKLSHKNIKGISIGSSTIDPINKYTFQDFPALTRIALYENDKTILEDEAFSNLRKIKKISIIYTTELKIQENVFKDAHVTELDFSNSHIEELGLSEFNTIAGLVRFRLRNSHLKKLHSTDNFLSKISYFDLKKNQLESLDLTSIEVHTLDVSENKLKNLMLGKNCEKLYASFNQLNNISLINSLSTLREIYINDNLLGNNLHEICECINLEELVLNKNKISDIGSCFSNMKNLYELSLKGNDISVIYSVSFHPENNIEYLDLSDNKLEYFLEDSMQHFPKMQHIKLNNNKIVALCNNPKYLMPNLKKIEIQNNNFERTELMNVWKKLKEQGVEISDLSEIRCVNLSTILHRKLPFLFDKIKKNQSSLCKISFDN